MEDQQSIYEIFTWKVENFSRLKNILSSKELYSEPFVLCGYPWRISLLTFENNEELGTYLSIYLEAFETANMSKEWRRDVKFRLIIHNQFDDKMTIREGGDQVFNDGEMNTGFENFISLTKLNDPQKGFLVNDACIFGVEICLLEAICESQVSQTTYLSVFQTFKGQIGHMEVEVPMPMPQGQGQNLKTVSRVSTLDCIEPTKNTNVELFSDSIGELMDFRGLGKIEKVFFPLLEEVCSQHPSLIECHQKRSRKFIGWAFNALGRVLYFLKSKKIKDMNDQACEDLQTLWDELEIFGFDLSWLEPRVQSTLGMKSYVEKVMQVEKLKENVVALELETERLRAKFVAAKVNLDVERDFMKEKGSNVSDLDTELGYGSWGDKNM